MDVVTSPLELQGLSLQVFSSVSGPTQGLPLLAGLGESHFLVLFLDPFLHEGLHVDQADQPPHLPWTTGNIESAMTSSVKSDSIKKEHCLNVS